MEASPRRPVFTLLAFVCLLSALNCVAWEQEVNPPSFDVTPPQLVEFSNTLGTKLPCSASARPFPSNVSWLGEDGSPLKPITGLREILPDGTLVLLPFNAEHFRQDVHATSYKCALSSSFGTIVSNDVTAKAVVLQPYDVYVYDVFTMRSSTAVMKCHVPKEISTYVTVSSWIKDSETISNLGLAQGSKFNIIPSGELYIKDVTASDGRSTFDCKVTNKLTGEIKKSITSGKLYFITDPQRTVPPNITFSKKTVFAKEGEIALLPCEAQALPMPNIRWSRRSGIGAHEGLALKDRYSLVSGSLLIKNVYKSNSGTYTCTASNVAGSETTDVQLVISERLIVSVDPANLIMDIGKPADLNCKTEGSPGTAIHWMKDAKPLPSLPGIQMHSNTSFRITSVSAEHEGIYQCFAKNNFEKAFAVAVLSLGDSPPVVVSGFKEHTLRPGSPGNLQCIFSGRPIPEVTWFIDGEAMPSNVVQKENQLMPTTIFRQL